MCRNKETEREKGRREREREIILRNWLSGLWRLVSPISAGWAVRMDTQRRTDNTVEVQRLSAGRIPSCLGEVNLLFYSAFN